MLAHLAGGMIDLSPNEDATAMKQCLLSPEGMTKRIALLDNVKRLRFSWAELESAITSPVISGKRMFVGEGQRPNNLLWIITLNGVSLARDLAQRSVIIQLSRPQRSASWADDTRRFIDKNRDALIADCIGVLRSERRPLDHYTRWSSWERDVLERLPDPTEAQAVIVERQALADVEDEEAGLVQEHFGMKLRELGYDETRDKVFIPSGVCADWYSTATRQKNLTTTAVTRMLKQSVTEGTVTMLALNKCNAYGRGFIWWGPLAELDENIYTDIEARISRQQGFH
jgi:hypothetical protein